MVDIYFWRQIYILISAILNDISAGVMLAFPSVLGPAITAANSTDISTTSDHASWISSVNGAGGLIGSFILAPIMQIYGRKACHITVDVCYLTGFLIFPFANSIYSLYAARVIQGVGAAGLYLKCFIISEYAHPTRRGYFITLKKTATAFGIFLCHTMDSFWTWRQISIFATIPLCASTIMTIFWPESPSFLAMKGKYDESKRSFEWLNGKSEESQMQLEALIETQREKRKMEKNNSCKQIAMTFLKKDFQKPLLVSSVLTLCVSLCGRYYYTAYLTQIMTELVDNSPSAIYFTIGSDLLTVLAISTSSIIIRYAKRRTILFTSGALSVVLMLAISLIVYLKSVFTFSTPALWFTVSLVILQSLVVNIGMTPISFALVSEIFPLEHKGLGGMMSTFLYCLLYAGVLKLAPVLIEHTKLYGTYGIFGITLAVFLLILYKTVPETKDKTLQQIEDELTNMPENEMIVLERNVSYRLVSKQT